MKAVELGAGGRICEYSVMLAEESADEEQDDCDRT
jgi:hypothetical protein